MRGFTAIDEDWRMYNDDENDNTGRTAFLHQIITETYIWENILNNSVQMQIMSL